MYNKLKYKYIIYIFLLQQEDYFWLFGKIEKGKICADTDFKDFEMLRDLRPIPWKRPVDEDYYSMNNNSNN